MGSEGFPLLPIDSLEKLRKAFAAETAHLCRQRLPIDTELPMTHGKAGGIWESIQGKSGSGAACGRIRGSITGFCL